MSSGCWAALVDGLSAEEIAETHFVAVTTVRSQVRGILQKLGVRSQLAAVATANRAGWTAPIDDADIARAPGAFPNSSIVRTTTGRGRRMLTTRP